ncbi:MAG: hypothetical protein CMG11_07590 [Candidatus Marinimicrobia bacterium]|nr:hypothetical protein [Candidatus Neomarinimicrobiota bacterium]
MNHNPFLHILGAGPAGLSIGYYAKKKNIPFTINEGSNQVGGNCRTIKNGDFKFDTGAHRFHDKIPSVTQEIKELMGDELLIVKSPSKIYKDGVMIDFPINFSSLLHSLSLGQICDILIENTFKRSSNRSVEKNFKNRAYHIYGKTLSNLFLINYTEKLWGRSADLLQENVAGDRLKNLDLPSIIKQKILGFNKYKNLDGTFFYPQNGFGSIFESMANHIGFDKINTNTPVKKITHKRGKITGLVCGNSKITDPEIIISSLPLDKTIHLMDPTPPNEILLAVNEIGYRNIKICVLFLDTPFFSENASIYFPDRKLNFTRIYEPKNRSAHMAPMDKTCIVIECPYDSGDQLSAMRNDEFYEMIINDLVKENLIKKDQIIDYDIFDMNNAYPILDLNIKEKKKKILSYLHTFENMYLIGRNAEFQYLHTHDIIAKGRKLIESFS